MKFNIHMNRLFQLVLCLSAASLVSGCVSKDISSLENQVAEIMARPGGRIKPLPEIKPYEAYTYKSLTASLKALNHL